MRISDWSSDVRSSDLLDRPEGREPGKLHAVAGFQRFDHDAGEGVDRGAGVGAGEPDPICHGFDDVVFLHWWPLFLVRLNVRAPTRCRGARFRQSYDRRPMRSPCRVGLLTSPCGESTDHPPPSIWLTNILRLECLEECRAGGGDRKSVVLGKS